MPQETNFNVSPYFDDFDKDKDYYRVLFKPGFPVQARELTTAQSILQNQIEQFGSNFFKEGQIVIPGVISYDNPIYAVELDSNFNGLPISLYFENLKGKRIQGLNSGVTAEIFNLIDDSVSERGNYTLYVKYLQSGGDDLNVKRFQDGETLIALDTISYGESNKFVIQLNQGICNTISINSGSEASSVSISEGVCFVRGIFANVTAQNIILDQYGIDPSYKVGFDIIERIVTADEDDSLYDNARSFTNYTAPGADRLKLELILTKKDLEDVELDSFVELMRVVEGIPQFSDVTSDQTKVINTAKTETSKAISDVSGDFFVKPFSVNVRDSLNDGLLNNGLYFSDQLTVSGNTPTEDKIVYQIGPGKAYVGGRVVETTSARLLDASKPRESDTCTKEVVPYNAGTLFVLNNTYGSAPIGLGTDFTISLMSDRIGELQHVASGTTIGQARVYDYVPESEYQNDLSRMHLRAFDIQTYTLITFTKSIPVYEPSFFRGNKSSATGHAKDYSDVYDLTSITFPTIGIGTVNFDQDSSTDIVEITTLNGETPHGLDVGDFVFVDGTGALGETSGESIFDYSASGKFYEVIGVDEVGTGVTFQIDTNIATGEIPSLDIENLGTFTKSTERPTLTFASGNPSIGEEIYITNTTNNKFNNNFIVEDIPGVNQVRLQTDVTALDYYTGATSSVLGQAAVGLTTVTLLEVDGQFLKGEKVDINGVSQGRILSDVVEYDLTDVKSIFSNDSVGISTFNADIILDKKSSLGPAGTLFVITPAYLGVSTVSAATPTDITTNLKIGDIVTYTNFSAEETSEGVIPPTFNKVVSISSNKRSFQVAGISSITDYISGGVYVPEFGTSNIETTNVEKISSQIYGDPDETSFLTKLNNDNISSFDLQNNVITQRRKYSNVGFSDNEISVSISPSEEDVFFTSFDEDKFVITFDDGVKEILRFDKYNISSDGKTATFVDLSRSTGTADVIVTVINNRLNSKSKKFNPVSVLDVSRSRLSSSGTGDGTLDDGLSFNRAYGTRVQDKDISLNVPDAIRVLAVFESYNSSSPTLPNIQISSSNINYVLGELITGQTSNAKALIVKKTNTDILEYVYLNTNTFEKGEVISSDQSQQTTNITSLTIGSKNITQNFDFDDGQTGSYYGYSKIIRKKNIEEPKRSLKIVYQNYTIDPSDTGEIISVNSYPDANFKHDVLSYGNVRLTDYVDLRPRVSKYSLSSNLSPFDYRSRNFSGDGEYAEYTLVPGENLNVCYKYYVGRIDKIILNSDGTFDVIEGIPSLDPIEPEVPENSLEIATVNLPAFTFDVDSIEVDVESHKRYTMEDIGLLEDRIRRLEEYTVLTALENKTENLSIKDAETGLERFKCGFFVDTFKNTDLHDEEDPDYKCAIDDQENVLRPTHYTTNIDMQLGSEVISGVGATFEQGKDHDFVTDLGSVGVNKTGDLITLNYDEEEYFSQPYATRAESVTPFLVKFWEGTIELHPPSDTWIEEREVVNRSFNTEVTRLPQEPDINITRVRNVVRNRVVFRNRVVVQRGIWWRRWITARRSWWWRGRWNRRRWLLGFRRRRWWSRFRRRSRALSTRFIRTNGRQAIQFRARRGRISTADIRWLRAVLPRDVAEGFITQIRRRGRNRLVFLRFAPGVGRDIARRTTRTTSTTVRTSATTTTTVIPPQISEETTVDEQTSNFTEPTRFLRSRNIEFDVKGLRPRTRFYSFFEGVSVANYMVPKLLEIEMVSGKFQIGETVESDPHFTSKKIRFRACRPDHKIGPFNNPTESFTTIPYRQTEPPEAYTESSDYINVDTRALQLNSEVDFYGEVAVNMRIIGKTSGAVARITNIRLISDNTGRLIGSLFVPDPKVTGNPQWINGENTFTVIDTPSLSEAASGDDNSVSESSAEEDFTSSSTTNVTVRNITTTRNIIIRPARNINTTTITNTRTNRTAVTRTRIRRRRRRRRINRRWERRDPLAQSFYVQDETGIFLTGVDVYFETKDESGIPVTMQLRTMENGVPTNTVFPFSEVTLTPDEINLSTDSSVPTRFTFQSPVYLAGPVAQEVRGAPIASEASAEYAVVLLSNSSNYRVFISRLGEDDILTNIKVGAQPTLGSLFKSQNGTTWTPSQLEDLKYKLYRAEFVEQGVVRYFNPLLSLKNEKVTVLGENQITTLSKKSVIKLNQAGVKSDVVPGVTIFQEGRAQGKLVGLGGSITAGYGVTVSNVGFGYTPASGEFVFTDIDLITDTGSGVGAAASVTVVDGLISEVYITNGGYGYEPGDYLKLPSIGQDVGFGGEITVESIVDTNTLIVDNVVKGDNDGDGGSFATANDILYKTSAGVSTYVGFVTSTGTQSQAEIVTNDTFFDGNHMRFDVMNHGMHSAQNYVRVSNIRPEDDEPNTTLTSELSSTETTVINVGDSTGFETFEGFQVTPTNPGYVIIGTEIVGYTTYTSTALGGDALSVIRGVDGTEVQPYESDIPVYKYQFNGVSLRRINKIHSLAETEQSTHKTTLNSFYVKVDSGDDDFDGNEIGVSRIGGSLNFNETASLGDSGGIVSTNVQFEILTPNFAKIVLAQTNLTARVRTFSATSIDGNESSFEDQGYIDMPLDEPVSFPTPRLVASVVNETRNIEDSPGNRSLSMEFNLSTQDSRVSPIIDDITSGAILTSNIVNAPAGVGDDSTFADVEYIRGGDDKHEAIYISKPITLKLPANSIKLFLKSSRTENNDIRVLYKLFREDAPDGTPNFEPFPGYANYEVDSSGIKRVVDASKNDGSADDDVNVTSDSEFKDFEYTIDNLPDFTGFAIKIIMASKNQAEPPLVKELRAIATLKPSV